MAEPGQDEGAAQDRPRDRGAIERNSPAVVPARMAARRIRTLREMVARRPERDAGERQRRAGSLGIEGRKLVGVDAGRRSCGADPDGDDVLQGARSVEDTRAEGDLLRQADRRRRRARDHVDLDPPSPFQGGGSIDPASSSVRPEWQVEDLWGNTVKHGGRRLDARGHGQSEPEKGLAERAQRADLGARTRMRTGLAFVVRRHRGIAARGKVRRSCSTHWRRMSTLTQSMTNEERR